MTQVTLNMSSPLADHLKRMLGIMGTERTVERFMEFQLSNLRHEIASMRADADGLSRINVTL